MRKTLSGIFKLVRKALSTIDLKVYAICVLISSFIWLVMTLSDNYSEEIEFPVSYSNFPKGMILVSHPPKVISARVKSQGFELASAALSNRSSVHIDLSKIHLKHTRYGRYVAAIATNQFRYNIINQLQVESVGKDFKPDSIYFVFDSLKTKNIAIKLNARINFQKEYMQYGDPVLTPSMVKVSGPALMLNKIKYINTDSLIRSKVHSNIIATLNLISHNRLLKLSERKVKVKIRVEKHSEFVLWENVKVISNIPNLKVKTFPSKVKLICTMALPDYKNLTDSSFQVVARLDSLDLLHSDKLILKIAKKPASASSVRLNTGSVEYVIVH